jgi:predicted dehydrogenase
MLAEKRFGQLISIEAGLFTSDVARRGPNHYLFDPQQSGRGFFNWLACHWFDLLLYLIDEPVVAVTARIGRFGATPVEVEDGGTAILELTGGAIVTFTGGYWLPRWAGESRWTIRGSDRWVHWEPSRPGTSGAFAIHGPQPQFIAMEETFTLPPDPTPGYGGQRTQQLIRDWLGDACTGSKTCSNTVDSTLATLRLLDVVYEASEKGRRVELLSST